MAKGRLDRQADELLQSARNLGIYEWHGWQAAKRHQEDRARRWPLAIGTLFRVLERLEQSGRIASRLEDRAVADAEGRPVRRMYHIVGQEEG